MHHLAKQIPLPDVLRERITAKEPVSVWECFDQPISKDLHPFIQRQFRSETAAGSAERSFVGALTYRLTETAQQLLDGGFGGWGEGLELQLSAGTIKRLSLDEGLQSGWVPIGLKKTQLVNSAKKTKIQTKRADAMLHLFGSGIGMLVLELVPGSDFVDKRGAEAVLEIVYALSHLRSSPALRWQQEGEKTGSFTIQNLMSLLLPFLPDRDGGEGSTITPVGESHFFTYTSVRTDSACEERLAEELVYRLSRRNTAHYLPAEQQLREACFGPSITLVTVSVSRVVRF